MTTGFLQRTIFVISLTAIVACSEPAPPRSVLAFENDRSGLDAKLVACFEDRRLNATDPECKNARAAAAKIERLKQSERNNQNDRQSEQRLDAVRRQREAKDAVSRQRMQALIERAESKVALGQALTADEARALGLDPDNSVLSEGADDLPAIAPPNSAERIQSPSDDASADSKPPSADDDEPPTSLAEIRESLKEKANGD